VAGGETSWHGYARHVIEFARRRAADPVARRGDRGRRPPAPTRRQRKGRIIRARHDKLQKAFGLNLPAWQEGVERMLTEVLELTKS
jgi:dTDP-4-dehydrorhamnose reductase